MKCIIIVITTIHIRTSYMSCRNDLVFFNHSRIIVLYPPYNKYLDVSYWDIKLLCYSTWNIMTKLWLRNVNPIRLINNISTLWGWCSKLGIQLQNNIYLVRDRTFVSRAIAPKIDLDMHSAQSLWRFVILFSVNDKLCTPLSCSDILTGTRKCGCGI